MTVFVAVAIVIGATFVVYSLQSPRLPASGKLTFSPVSFDDGNVSFGVQNVSGGPYAYTGFAVTLVVNEIASGAMTLSASDAPIHVGIGPNNYRIVWSDSNGSGLVDVGDRFAVTGDGGPLPSLSAYEFDLRWQAEWTVKATWSTP